MITDRFRGLRDGRQLNRLRRDCDARLGTMDIPFGGTVAALCERVSTHRRRSIQLVPVVMPATHPCGFWLATDAVDFILYEANTSRTHQEHIVAHELAHIICCHRGAMALDDASARALFPDVDPQLVRDMLRRTSYTDAQEREAEVMASVILERLHRERSEPVGHNGADDAIARVARSLTYRAVRPRNPFRTKSRAR